MRPSSLSRRAISTLTPVLLLAATLTPAIGLGQESPPRLELTRPPSPPATPPFPTRVAPDGRHLLDQTGRPFLYLGDTAWELFHRLTFDEADRYLRDRAAKGFNVIQAVALAEYGGLTEPTPGGALPLEANDPTRPVEAYFQHVDRVIDRANELGLVVGLLPTWGDKWKKKWGQGPEVFDPENARTYGRFLGTRYRDRALVWILGGDRPVENDRHRAIIRAMAEGLAEGDGGRHLMTFHPAGGRTSAEAFGDDPWLAFHMAQTGHNFDNPNYRVIASLVARSPARPCLDGEPGYEDHPAAFKAENGYLGALDARKAAYWAFLAGACGHTYGCHDIWQFFDPARHPAVTAARTPWTQALDLSGAGQMRHLRRLVESRPTLVPDQSLLVGDEPAKGDHRQAARGADGGFALIYTPTSARFLVSFDPLSGDDFRATWFDPTTGRTEPSAIVPRRAGFRHQFAPPASPDHPDWVLILDDCTKGYPLP